MQSSFNQNNSLSYKNYNSDTNSINNLPLIDDRLSFMSYISHSSIDSYNSINIKNITSPKLNNNDFYNIENNKIFERTNYIKNNIQKHTYNNKKKYQIIFNKIIFNIK